MYSLFKGTSVLCYLFNWNCEYFFQRKMDARHGETIKKRKSKDILT